MGDTQVGCSGGCQAIADTGSHFIDTTYLIETFFNVDTYVRITIDSIIIFHHVQCPCLEYDL